MTYLYGVAIIFLFYLQIRIIRHKKQDRKQKRENIQPDAGATPAMKTKDNLLVLKRTIRPTSSHGSLVELTDQRGGTDQIALEEMTPKTQAKLRTTQTAMDLLDSPRLRRHVLDNGNTSMPESDDLMQFGEDEVEEYISVVTQTASIGHEGANLYVRLGCLGKAQIIMVLSFSFRLFSHQIYPFLLFSPVFAIANIVYISLEIHSQTLMKGKAECEGEIQLLYPFIFHLIFVLCQTFFLFKISGVSGIQFLMNLLTIHLTRMQGILHRDIK